jgi:hypothetical protein
MFYFKNVKSYFQNLKYPQYMDEEDPNVEKEFTNPQKFMVFYGLLILYIFVFAFMVMNYVYGFNSKIAFFWNTIFLFLIMFLTGLFIKFTFLRKQKRQIFTFAIIFVAVILNKPVGKGLQKIVDNMIDLFKRSKS